MEDNNEKLNDGNLTATLPRKDTGYSNNPPRHNNKRAETALQTQLRRLSINPRKTKMQARKNTSLRHSFFPYDPFSEWMICEQAGNEQLP